MGLYDYTSVCERVWDDCECIRSFQFLFFCHLLNFFVVVASSLYWTWIGIVNGNKSSVWLHTMHRQHTYTASHSHHRLMYEIRDLLAVPPRLKWTEKRKFRMRTWHLMPARKNWTIYADDGDDDDRKKNVWRDDENSGWTERISEQMIERTNDLK